MKDDSLFFGGGRLSSIVKVIPREGYQLEVYLQNGHSVTLNMAGRLKTLRFGELKDEALFRKAATDGSFVRWNDRIEISVRELFQLAQE